MLVHALDFIPLAMHALNVTECLRVVKEFGRGLKPASSCNYPLGKKKPEPRKGRRRRRTSQRSKNASINPVERQEEKPRAQARKPTRSVVILTAA
jgi:hypothetical protein